MAKIDKSKFSKEQWKIIQAERRKNKEIKQNAEKKQDDIQFKTEIKKKLLF